MCLTLVFNVAVRLLLLDKEAFPDGKDASLRFVRRQEVRRALVDRAFEGRRRKAFVPVAFDHGVPLREEGILLLHRRTLDDPPRDSFTSDFATGVFVRIGGIAGSLTSKEPARFEQGEGDGGGKVAGDLTVRFDDIFGDN